MALEEFEKDQLNENEKRYVQRKSIMDFGMGTLWVGMGIFVIFIKKFNPRLAELYGDTTMKVFGVICLVYGLFRMWRGYKKKYFKD
jgi:hypothetical protein